MKTFHREVPKCDLCQREAKVVYDMPVGGRWGFICPKCIAEQQWNVPAHASCIVGKDDKSWRERFPLFWDLVKSLPYTDVGQSYFQALDRAWCMYEDEGLKAQIPYLIGNLLHEVVVTDLERMSKEGLE